MVRPSLHLRGKPLLDVDGAAVGRIADTWPLDGSGEADYAVVQMGRFSRPRLVPLRPSRHSEDGLQVPYTRLEIDDAPLLDLSGHYDPAGLAHAYWQQLTDAEALGYDAVARERINRRAAPREPYPLVYAT